MPHGLKSDPTLEERIAVQARTWLGTPFVDRGRVKGAHGGVDCVGLLVCVARELGLTVTDKLAYNGEPHSPSFLAALASHLDRVTRPEAPEAPLADVIAPPSEFFGVKPGLIVAFWQANNWSPCHAGIAVDGGFIHAVPRRAAVSSVTFQEWTPFWSKRVHSLWRWRS